FRLSPAERFRVKGIKSAEVTDCGVILTCGSEARKTEPGYTHETPLYFNNPAEGDAPPLYIHIQLWTDSIFRIVFSGEKEIKDPYSRIPAEARMLVGEMQKAAFTYEDNVLRTKEIVIRIDPETGRISAAWNGGGEFFAQRKSEFTIADVYDLSLSKKDGLTACFEALELDNDELIYGLGERFDSLTRNGRAVDFHNKDCLGTATPRTYINIPFFMSTKGYGLFLNSAAKTDWQIGTLSQGSLQFGALYGQLDYFVIPGRAPKDILKGYCYLTGFAKLPPLWSFGLWMSRNSYTSWDVVEKIAREIRENDVPCDVIHLDTAWFAEDWNCDLKFSRERFPEPEKHMKELMEKGFNVSLWQYNFIPPRENNTHYKEAVERGYLALDEDGTPFQYSKKHSGGFTEDVIVDFTDPEARKWYADKIKKLMDMGASAIKTDFGEGIPEEAIFRNVDGRLFHNLYTLVYNWTVFNASKENIVWARSGTAGSQRFPLHWGGDSQCTFEDLAGTLRGALSIGMSGIPFFSHDIGGFIGLPDDELYIRWAQLGLFSSHSRCHGAGDTTHREPWAFSKEALEIFRFYDKLRYSLMPYIYEQAEKCTRTGLPMMRALYLEYPEDRNVRMIDDQYLFGDSLLIAPVLKPLSKSKTRDVYLPKGVWFDYFTKEKIVSDGKWISRDIDLRTMPIYVKEGTELKYCSAGAHLKGGMGEIIKTEKW
ncbi:MAG: hypothetical protein ILO36_08265, partial [Abditibacteriota bacterium]|nr:hypothetical protein [Abditibacteriota bacterium]